MVSRVSTPEVPDPPKAAPKAEKEGLARRAAVALARRDFLRKGGRWAVGGALSAWLLGSQTVEVAHAGTPSSPHCSYFNASGYGCYYRYCFRYTYDNRCQARLTDCNNWPGANGQCWNWDGRRFCDWWVYPPGGQRPCHCSQLWP
jgi:hypothetical protein